ncbi:hypothetical protein BAUCODRAFT_419686 [Baudoinia panamericana UAMH 10762]|uniref:Secreted protein n=1 Tax=Baudoinia panamericana (strain UAMH 10762) TaxID=717646 RepID=M2MNM3_BAUPA|nr:uncharacterized protein BAUCODRAFT_419686 [Baudoinia panamericana UAMH 10762]EMC98286.1 hypothetical protein BAUCODRAFT_419686 [Baudoinia panamericana UAMH 10762]
MVVVHVALMSLVVSVADNTSAAGGFRSSGLMKERYSSCQCRIADRWPSRITTNVAEIPAMHHGLSCLSRSSHSMCDLMIEEMV